MNIIIILNYNDYKTTLDYIEIIKNYSVLDKIIIVDNCSTDNSYSILKEKENDKIDVIKTYSNGGYASGNNFGIKYSEKQYKPKNIIISNPDIIVSEASIKNICKFLDSNEDVAAASGLIHDINGIISKNSAWKLPTYKDLLIGTFLTVYKFCEIVLKINSSYDFNKLYNEKNQKKIFKVDVLSGCFFVIKDSVLRKINYFDERTFLYCEESILSHKIKEIGLKECVLCPEKIVHLEGVSVNKNIKSWKTKNKILLDSRNVYLDNYLKVSKWKKVLYNILFSIGQYEYYILVNIRNKFRDLKKG